MRIVFFGSGKIAINTLEALVESSHEIACVVTAPDKRKGRHLLLSTTSIKQEALKFKLNIYQPLDPSSSESINYLKQLAPDLFIVFSYGKILSKELLSIPKILPINIHTSLLPKYRGAAPINWALINGEAKTGITVIKMNEQLDEGDTILKEEMDIDYSDNAETLGEKLAKLTPTVLIEALKNISEGGKSFSVQDNNNASFAPKLKKKDGKIDWNIEAKRIRNRIRGCIPWPGAFTLYNGEILKIWDAEVVKMPDLTKYPSGTVISVQKNGIMVSTSNDVLLIQELQLASGRRLKAWEFAQGRRIKSGIRFI